MGRPPGRWAAAVLSSRRDIIRVVADAEPAHQLPRRPVGSRGGECRRRCRRRLPGGSHGGECRRRHRRWLPGGSRGGECRPLWLLRRLQHRRRRRLLRHIV